MRVAICQPLVPKYRVPVFESLGALSGIELSVFAGGSRGSLQAVEAGRSFRLVPAPLKNFHVGPLEARYQAAQLEVMDPARFDAVILSWDAHYLSLPLALAKAKLHKVPVLLWGHGFSKVGSGARDILRNAYGRWADGVLLYNRTVAESLEQNAGFDRRRVFVAQNAIDQGPIQRAIEHWTSRPAELAAFRREHGIIPEQTIVFVSRLEPDNDIDLLIESFALLRERFPRSRLVLIGDGSSRQSLEETARRLGVSEHTIFAGAIYQEERVAPWMMSAAVFAYPTNIGLSLMHAFGYGLPVVTSDNIARHNPEIEALRDGQNGLFYREGDCRDFALKISTLLSAGNLRKTLSVNARRQVLETYNLKNMVGGFVEALQFVQSGVKLDGA